MENKRILRHNVYCKAPIINNIDIPNPVNVNVFEFRYGLNVFIFRPQLFFGYI